MSLILLHDCLKMARTHLRAGQYSDALTLGQHILRYYPKHLATYRLLAEASTEMNDLDSATDLYLRVYSADPENVAALIGLADIHVRHQEFTEAIWYLERAFEIQPTNPELRQELLRLYSEHEGAPRTRLELTAGGLARLYARQGMYPQAIQEFRALLRSDPTRLDIQAALIEATHHKGRKRETADLAQSLLAQLPFCLKANLLLGVLWRENDAAEAEPLLQRAFAMDPEREMARELQLDHLAENVAPTLPRLEEPTVVARETPVSLVTGHEPIGEPDALKFPEKPIAELQTPSESISPEEKEIAAAIIPTPIVPLPSHPRVAPTLPRVAPTIPGALEKLPAWFREALAAQEKASAEKEAKESASLQESASSAPSAVTTDGQTSISESALTRSDEGPHIPPTQTVSNLNWLIQVATDAPTTESENPAWFGAEPTVAEPEPEPLPIPPSATLPSWLHVVEPEKQAVSDDTASILESPQTVTTEPVVPKVIAAEIEQTESQVVSEISVPIETLQSSTEAAVAPEGVLVSTPEEITPQVVDAPDEVVQEMPPSKYEETLPAWLRELQAKAVTEPETSEPDTRAPAESAVTSASVTNELAAEAISVQETEATKSIAEDASPKSAIESESLLEQARTQRRSRNNLGAIELYEKVLHSDSRLIPSVIADLEELKAEPNVPMPVYRLLGDAYSMAGRFKEALEQYRMVLGR